MSYAKIWKLVVLTLLVGVVTGFFLNQFFNGNKIDANDVVLTTLRLSNSKYQYTNPLLGIEFVNNKAFQQLGPLEDLLNSLYKAKKEDNSIQDASIYFRELGNGQWVGINQEGSYAPQSLLKVPLMIAYLKAAESDPELLSKKILYDTNKIHATAPLILQPNMTYTVDELIRDMIVNSDNAAKDMLLQNIDRKLVSEVFTDLGIEDTPEKAVGEYRISAKQYSLFFRSLYNSTMLSNNMSETALKILSDVNFQDGLVAGLPVGTKIAHKYGERITYDDKGVATGFELHDCGIVYYSKQPYFLCVMTQGTNLDTLKKTIKDFSKTVFEFESGVYGKKS